MYGYCAPLSGTGADGNVLWLASNRMGGAMTVNETLVATGARPAANSDEQFSAAWWQRRTPEELRDIIKRGFAGGEAFQGAVSETERRAREETSRLREIAAIEAEQWRKRKQVILVSVSSAAVLASVSWWFAG